jgi:hypothetical protein
MLRTIAALILALNLTACDAVNTVTEGFQHARAVERDLESSTGLKPQVGFNWHNGRLLSVTVQFPRLYDAKPLRELAPVVRTAVESQFKQKPDQIVVSFALGAEGS